mmetsp:Transcript_8263/g.18546  ORF Transcript_8263/g.18546 Transcript_8263/m.18546 type:complete len:849 (+) Transcript_8263:21-2567(+)
MPTMGDGSISLNGGSSGRARVDDVMTTAADSSLAPGIGGSSRPSTGATTPLSNGAGSGVGSGNGNGSNGSSGPEDRTDDQEGPLSNSGSGGSGRRRLRSSNPNSNTNNHGQSPNNNNTTTTKSPPPTPNRNQISAMLSNFTTSYNVLSISLALPILSTPTLLPYSTAITPDTDSICASSLLGGMVVGQLLGGMVSDLVGRVQGLYGAVALQILGSLMSSLVGIYGVGGDGDGGGNATNWDGSFGVRDGGFDGGFGDGDITVRIEGEDDKAEGGEGMTMFDWLSLWRFVLGIGAGAIYPIAAVLSAEADDDDDDNDYDYNDCYDDCNDDYNDDNDVDRDDAADDIDYNDNDHDTGVANGQDDDEHHHYGHHANDHDHMHDHQQDVERDRHEKETRKLHNIAITFSTQGLGFVAVPALAYPLLLLLGEELLDLVWRLILGFGAVPGIVMILVRWCCCCSGGGGGSGSGGNRRRRRRRRRRGDFVPLESPLDEDDNDGIDVIEDPTVAQEGGGEVTRENEVPLVQVDSSNHDVVDGASAAGSPLDDCGGDGDDTSNDDYDDGDVLQLRRQQPQHHHHHHGIVQSIKSEPNLFRKLCGTAGTWFLFDILFYGNTLFQPIVLETAFGKKHTSDDDGGGGGGNVNPDDEFDLLVETARDSLFLSLIALPGYFVSIVMLGRTSCCGIVEQTPRYVQMQGFALMSILYAVVGGLWTTLSSYQVLLVLLYGSTFFFANYGPNATTFLLPSVTYSHDCRSTLNGISAAAGKAGALLGASVFEPTADALGDGAVMLICSGISVVALLLTWGCVRTASADGDGQSDGDSVAVRARSPTTVVNGEIEDGGATAKADGREII